MSYWEWGWGHYGSGNITPGDYPYWNPMDVARYDWSIVQFANLPISSATTEYMDSILSYNPNHKFFLRLVPTIGLGDVPASYNRLSWAHWLYDWNGARAKTNLQIEEQVGYALACSNPDAIIGASFLEELPRNYISSDPFYLRSIGDPVPWDFARFLSEIEADLGTSLNLDSEAHRLWWGARFCEMLRSINAKIKTEVPAASVMVWIQANEDPIDTWAALGKTIMDGSALPISYADILDENCTGIFGFPTSEATWNAKYRDVAIARGCKLFSQVSRPPRGAVLCYDRVARVRDWVHDDNLGLFIYHDTSAGRRAINIQSTDGTSCSLTKAAGVITTTKVGGSGGNLNIDTSNPLYDTIAELAAYINGVAGYSCEVQPLSGTYYGEGWWSSATLEDVTGQDILSAPYNWLIKAAVADAEVLSCPVI